MYRFDDEIAPYAAGLPARDLRDLAAAREQTAAGLAAAPPVDATGVLVEDRQLPGGPLVRTYRPSEPGPVDGVILHAHGGGFVMCTLDTSHRRGVTLSRELGVAVVSVDYRLAPEHPYPAAVEDVYAALEWLGAGGAAEMGADPARIVLHGNSAGGGLAAATTLLARDRGGPRPCFQFLNMPVLDDRQDSDSMRRFVDTPMWDQVSSGLSWVAYLGEGRPGSADVEPYAAPARATDLSRLPPAYVSVMEFDPLRDEGIAYAARLLQAGVPTELHVFPGTFHGSTMVVPSAIGTRELTEELAVLRAALRPAELSAGSSSG